MGPETAKNGKKENAKMKKRKDRPIRRWECRHAIFDRYGETQGWKCNVRMMFGLSAVVVSSGCWPDKCIHNSEGDNPEFRNVDIGCRKRGEPLWTQCPIKGTDGKCRCLGEDGEHEWCKVGERESLLKSDSGCLMSESYTRWPHPVFGCTMAEAMTPAQLLETANAYMYDMLEPTGRKWYYANWFRSMLRKIGAPKEIVDRVPGDLDRKDWRERTKDEFKAVGEGRKAVLARWEKWYKAERRMLASENGEE